MEVNIIELFWLGQLAYFESIDECFNVSSNTLEILRKLVRHGLVCFFSSKDPYCGSNKITSINLTEKGRATLAAYQLG
jgi:hypothetical protein